MSENSSPSFFDSSNKENIMIYDNLKHLFFGHTQTIGLINW